MKQKPDETLDHWVRHTLRQLPDTSPAGSSFDSERLWGQLRPELQSVPFHRKHRILVWLAAACLTGLSLGWLWRPQSDNTAPEMAGLADTPKANIPNVSHSTLNIADPIAIRKPVIVEKEQHLLTRRTYTRQREKPKVETTLPPAAPTDVIGQTPESPIVVDVSLSTEKVTERSKPNVAKIISKRRFQVVHENELRAEEATRPKLYRSEHFVRLGVERNDEPVQEQRAPALRMPLATKSN